MHCSDAHFQAPFRAFLRDELGLAADGLVAVPGGPHCLTFVNDLPKFSWVGWRWTTFLHDLMCPRRIIVVGHDDCRWYQGSRFRLAPETTHDRQMADLRRVVAALGDRFPAIGAEACFARVDGNQVSFDNVA